MDQIITNDRLVAVVNSDTASRNNLCKALRSFYNVLSLEDGRTAIRRLNEAVPAVIIVDECVNPGDSISLIDAIRSEEKLRHIPIIHVVTYGGERLFQQGKAAGAMISMQHPFQRSFLINTISRILDANVEREWNNLSDVPKQTLKQTSHAFKNLANFLMTGDNMPFQKITQACVPLVKSIQTEKFLPVLDGVYHHDDFTFAHSLRVASFLTLLGQRAGSSEDELLMLASGGLLHDIGKMMIPYDVLNKPGKLTDAEFDVMKSHVTHTVDYLGVADDIPPEIMVIAEQHHEKLDGTGYPHGLKGGELNEMARMSVVVDVFSGMTDRRTYREAMSAEKAIDIMSNEMVDQLDQKFVQLFKELIGDAGILNAPANQHETMQANSVSA